MAEPTIENRDATWYEQTNRALKVGYYVPWFVSVGATAAQVLALSDEGWRVAHLGAQRRAGVTFNPASDETRLMIMQVLRTRERQLAQAATRPLPTVRSA